MKGNEFNPSSRQPKLLGRVLSWILNSPWAKTGALVVFTVVTNILTGTLLIEITTQQGIDWGHIYKTVSLWFLIPVVLAYVWYCKTVIEYERSIERFADDDYCIAYMRSQCLPAMAAKYKRVIGTGKGDELVEAMDRLKEALK